MWLWVIVAGIVAGVILLANVVSQQRNLPEGSFVQQLEAWRANDDPPIKPLALPPVRPLVAHRVSVSTDHRERRRSTSIRFPHAAA